MVIGCPLEQTGLQPRIIVSDALELLEQASNPSQRAVCAHLASHCHCAVHLALGDASNQGDSDCQSQRWPLVQLRLIGILQDEMDIKLAVTAPFSMQVLAGCAQSLRQRAFKGQCLGAQGTRRSARETHAMGHVSTSPLAYVDPHSAYHPMPRAGKEPMHAIPVPSRFHERDE